MRRNTLIIATVLLFAALSMLLRPHPVEHGNTLVVLSGSSPDYLDPGITYTAVSWQLMFNTYDGLLTYRKSKGVKGNELVPDLAAAMPEVLDGGRTYRFTMRRGVMFGPPANREVLPSDMKWSIERLFKLPSPGMGSYMVIEGADALASKKSKGLSGIEADDQARTITFRLTQPDATFPYKLAMIFAVAVPKQTPAKDMTFAGFTPATGPYQFESYTPQRRIVMKRNPAFRQWSPDVPDGGVDGIEIQLGAASDNAVTKIRQGTADFSLDGIGSTWLPRLRSDPHWRSNIHREAQAGLSYIFMNTTVAPFDNVKVRQAVNWAIDRKALVKLLGGRAQPTENVLPSLMPGYRQHDLYPGPDLDKARQLIAASGITPGKISFWCMAADGPNPTAEYMQHVLQELGFTVELKCLDYSVFYTTIGNPSNKAQIGFYSWVQDFPEGSNFIDVLLNGKRITNQGNNNMAMYSGADEEIARSNALLDQDARNEAWAKLDEKIMRDAPWAPYAVPLSYSLTSDRVCGYEAHPIYSMMFMKVRLRADAGEECPA